MEHVFTVQNLKCGGCAATIKDNLSALPQVIDVQINVDDSTVTVKSEQVLFNEITARLSNLGYPLIDAKNTLVEKAKSFMSCGLGRIGQLKNK